jgi:hypothetical protein
MRSRVEVVLADRLPTWHRCMLDLHAADHDSDALCAQPWRTLQHKSSFTCTHAGLIAWSQCGRFLEALERAGAVPVRAPAYVSAIGLPPTECLMERDMLERGAISAIAFSSQAEVVTPCLPFCPTHHLSDL